MQHTPALLMNKSTFPKSNHSQRLTVQLDRLTLYEIKRTFGRPEKKTKQKKKKLVYGKKKKKKRKRKKKRGTIFWRADGALAQVQKICRNSLTSSALREPVSTRKERSSPTRMKAREGGGEKNKKQKRKSEQMESSKTDARR